MNSSNILSRRPEANSSTKPNRTFKTDSVAENPDPIEMPSLKRLQHFKQTPEDKSNN